MGRSAGAGPADAVGVVEPVALLAVGVVAATGVAVWLTASRWPDLIAGAILAVVFLQSGWSIIRQSREELKAAA